MNTLRQTPRRRRSDREPRYGWVMALVITLLVAVLDWSTKAIVAATIPVGRMVEVWDGRLALWHVKNPEMVLGLWGNLPIESRMVIAAVAAILALLLGYEIVERGHRLPTHRRPWVWLFVGLACGGMLGNIGERLVYWSVTDFLALHWAGLWLPPANFADLALFLSMPAAVPVMVFELRARALRRAQAEADAASLAVDVDVRARLAGGPGS